MPAAAAATAMSLAPATTADLTAVALHFRAEFHEFPPTSVTVLAGCTLVVDEEIAFQHNTSLYPLFWISTVHNIIFGLVAPAIDNNVKTTEHELPSFIQIFKIFKVKKTVHYGISSTKCSMLINY